jgi:hypothetical protein
MRVARWSPFDAPLPPPERNIAQLMVATDRRHGFETPDAAHRERLGRIATLRQSPDPRALIVADRLASCDRDARCLSPACSICVGRTRIWIYGEIARLWNLRGTTAAADLHVITLVHEDWTRSKSALQDFDPGVLVGRVRHQFRRAGITGVTVLGAVHGEFDKRRGYWQPHLHLAARGMRQADLNLLRQRHYRRSSRIDRPMVVQSVDYPARQISYLYKSYWPMRVRYIDAFGEEKSTFRRIPEPYHSQYLIMLNQVNLLDLMLLIGVRRSGNTLQSVPR